jgi:hypothetical protein
VSRRRVRHACALSRDAFRRRDSLRTAAATPRAAAAPLAGPRSRAPAPYSRASIPLAPPASPQAIVPAASVSGAAGRTSSFEVMVGTELVHSKLASGAFPDYAVLAAAIAKKLMA